jgi:hypothetical protein
VDRHALVCIAEPDLRIMGAGAVQQRLERSREQRRQQKLDALRYQ